MTVTVQQELVFKKTVEKLAEKRGQRVVVILLITVAMKANLTVNHKVKVEALALRKLAREFFALSPAGCRQLMVEGSLRRYQSNMLHS